MKEIIEKLEQLYTKGANDFGNDPKSIGMKTTTDQYQRYQKLLQVVSKDNFTINDLGCGYGELVNYMRASKVNFNRYFGYEISEKMLDIAKENIKGEDCEWIISEKITQKADYSVCGGIFSVKFNADEKEWEAYILKTLHHMFENSEAGFAFNSLSTYVDFKNPNLYYGDPKYYFDYCLRNFSKKVALSHDYGLFEWTIYVHK